ncbi:hypothetical protein SIN8267_03197 [Sinobacterium norvegicum]|uniref:N-acetyltransferase domain-containing protein n=2 Tax=Sinobacterium norvegicum TaxID=1641715 RepID=A0ABN8EKW2_9GAMM|nr:hypothetical protein SIN8267_03197 [Sinobacterium norvegicum]
MALFDANCPEFFALNERKDYVEFLAAKPAGYELCLKNGRIVGAFGLFGLGAARGCLDWTLISPACQGGGIGSSVMERVIVEAKAAQIAVIDIATSHKAYRFFEKKGAVKIGEQLNGWGQGMHRIDMKLAVGV